MANIPQTTYSNIPSYPKSWYQASCTLVSQLAAHLKGLNDELISVKARLTAHEI